MTFQPMTLAKRANAIAWLLALALGCSSGSSGTDAGRDVRGDAPADVSDDTAVVGDFDAADATQLGDASCNPDADNVRTTCNAKTATTIYLCPFRQQVATCPAGCAVESTAGPFDPAVHCKPGPDAGSDADGGGDGASDAASDG
jgi:hypothetical protein